MIQRPQWILASVTLGFGAVAVYTVTSSRPETTAQAKAGTPLFETLRARVNDVVQVRVTTAAETYTLARGDAGWGLAEKGGYPVDVDRVKGLVVGLSELGDEGVGVSLEHPCEGGLRAYER